MSSPLSLLVSELADEHNASSMKGCCSGVLAAVVLRLFASLFNTLTKAVSGTLSGSIRSAEDNSTPCCFSMCRAN